MIENNYNEIISSIKSNCANINKNFEDITIIAVSKTVSPEKIREAYNLGIRDFGENKVQEMLSKMEILPKDINWHFIGNLQSNKVKQIVGKVSLIQSVDSYKLMDEIDKHAKKLNIIQNILIEVNIGLEDTKGGINPSNLNDYLQYASKLDNIHILGLMCIPPKNLLNVENFSKMRNIFVDNAKIFSHNINMNILSMGMSSDYNLAISQGSNMVRIGQAFFGERNH